MTRDSGKIGPTPGLCQGCRTFPELEPVLSSHLRYIPGKLLYFGSFGSVFSYFITDHLVCITEHDLRKNLKFFQVPETTIESIGLKLTMRIFDEYGNILRYMYSTRFNGFPGFPGDYSVPRDPHPLPSLDP